MVEIKEYRGHIRNHAALCAELGIDDALPRAEREIQILQKAYAAWGTEMGNHLYGMFAFALWDPKQSAMVCIRDQFGTKPFYYYITADGKFLCGTMIRTIMAQDGFVKQLNEKMLQYYLTMTYTAGEETFFVGLKKLLPGRCLVFQDGKCTITRYWKPEFHPDTNPTMEQWADEIHSTMQQLMQEIKEPDETAESFLSGGVDSSYVLALSDAKAANTCGYEEARFDESVLAMQTADLLGRACNRCVVTPEQFFEIVPFVMYNMEQPLGDASAIVFAIGCRETAKHTRLCYSGEGADEFFGGYNMYARAEVYGDNLKNFYVGNTNIMKEEEKQRLMLHYDPTVLPIDLAREIYAENEGIDPLSKMSDVDIQLWLEGDIYLNVDKMSTAVGLEVRMPMTDCRVFDIASRMPSCYKVADGQNKIAMRNAAAKVLPDAIAFRKKLGFIVPIRIWLADERYNADVRRLLQSDIAAQFFHMDEVAAIFRAYTEGDSDLWRKVWTIYTFLVWYEEYFIKH